MTRRNRMRLLGFNGGSPSASIPETETEPPTPSIPKIGTLLGDDSGKNDEGYNERLAQLALMSQGVTTPSKLKAKRNPRSRGQPGDLSYKGARIF